MRLGEAVQFYQGLQRYSSLERDLPRKITYAVGVNRRRLRNHIEEYEVQAREIVKKFAMRDEAGNMIPSGPQGAGVHIDPSRSEEYLAEMKELDRMEIDLDIHMVDLDQLPPNFPPAIQTALEPMWRAPNDDQGGDNVVSIKQTAAE